MIYSDAYLNHYADRYVRENLADKGISLEQYLEDPARYSILQAIPADMCDWASGKEKLKHHRHPKNHRRGTFRAFFQGHGSQRGKPA